MSHTPITSKPDRLFNYRRLLIFSAGFLLLLWIVRRIALGVCNNWVAYDCPGTWPISIFKSVWPTPQRILTAMAVLALFYFLYNLLERTQFRLPYVILAGILLVVGSNLIQGWQIGLYAPVSGGAYTGTLIPITAQGQEYYHDVLNIDDPSRLVFHYNEEQLKLNQHSYTHPPGAILLFYCLLKLLRHPGLVSLFIAIVSCSFSAFFLQRLLLTEVDPAVARFATFLYLILPAIQIYYLATLDALIATVMLGTLYCFRRADDNKYLIFATILLTTSFLLTFVALFVLPVLVFFDVIERRSLKRSLVMVVGLVGFHLLLYFVFGYNAWHSFRTTSHYENPHGFMLLIDPVNYLFTRLEDVFELAVFLGPWLILLIARGFKVGWRTRSRLALLAALGILALLGMFVTGAFRTGETGRAAIFIFPYFLIPIALLLHSLKPDRSQRWQLAGIVFAHTVLMQIIGNYFY